MRHVEEFKLEMLALDGPLETNERREIDQHLADCEYCRRQSADILSFYEEVQRQIRDHKVPGLDFGPVFRDTQK